MVPGLILGAWCLFMPEPSRGESRDGTGDAAAPRGWSEALAALSRTRSYVWNTAGMTLMTFVMGGVAAWVPVYIFEKEARFRIDEPALKRLADKTFSDGTPAVPPAVLDKLRAAAFADELPIGELHKKIATVLEPKEVKRYGDYLFSSDTFTAPGSITIGSIGLAFGGILCLSGLVATLVGGWLGDRLRARHPGSYFLVSGVSILLAFPAFLGVIFTSGTLGWVCIFVTVFLPVPEHGAVEHDHRQRHARTAALDGVRGQHSRHPLARGCLVADAYGVRARRFEFRGGDADGGGGVAAQRGVLAVGGTLLGRRHGRSPHR